MLFCETERQQLTIGLAIAPNSSPKPSATMVNRMYTNVNRV